ncbi:MAG: hypothetical protein AB8G96_09270 [Phycisphaerales bacterium]
MASEAVDLQSGRAAAAVSAGRLAAAGIPVRLVDVDPPGWSILRRGGQTDERVMVVVPADRADEAREVLAAPPSDEADGPGEFAEADGSADLAGVADPAEPTEAFELDPSDGGSSRRSGMPAPARLAMVVAIIVMAVSLIGMIAGAIVSAWP